MNAYYKVYLESTINLVGSLIYKFQAVADSMNQELVLRGHAIPKDKTEWRYYKHLAGDYHSFDIPMEIISLDTGETIPFTKASLKVHKKTQNVYYNTPSYINDLIARFPVQSILIKGIIRPVDYSVSIPADDGKIFHYDNTLVEWQEFSLITRMEDFIRRFLRRYMMVSYQETDDLFIAGLIGMLTVNLISAVLKFRNEATRAAEVHSFHIERYLASHNRMDEFLPYLTYEQKFWLYMNIAYIERHTGMQNTFDLLVENLMTKRGLPMYEYSLRQKGIDLDSKLLAPEPVFERKALNLAIDALSRTVDERSIGAVLLKEIPDATDNAEYYGQYVEEATRLTQDSSTSLLPTKIVEASAVDPEDVNPVKTMDVIMAEWFYLSATNRYINTIDIINPVSGNIMKLNMQQAVVMFVYAFYLGFHDYEMTKIPVIPAMGVDRLRWISDAEYRKRLPPHDFDIYAEDIDFFQKTYYELEKPLLDADSFLEACDEITRRKRLRHQYANVAHRYQQRGIRKMLYNTSYVNIYCTFTDPRYSDYKGMFEYFGLDRSMMYSDTWQDLALSILDACTMFNTKATMSVRQIQAAMVQIFKRLSGYTVQFLEEIVSSDCAGTHSNGVIAGHTDETTEGKATALICPMKAAQIFATHEGVSVAGQSLMVKAIDIIDVETYSVNAQYILQAEAVSKAVYQQSVIIPTVTAVRAERVADEAITQLKALGANNIPYLGLWN